MKKLLLFTLMALVVSCSNTKEKMESMENCGPQTPRDISNKAGTNPVTFATAPKSSKLNLCNIHFHKNAEHKGPEFSINKGEGKHDGFACNMKVDRSMKKFKKMGPGACKGIEVGDTIEVHWVHSSCNVSPGKTLGACLSEDCTDPKLRVETQVFMLVNDSNAASFTDYTTLKKRNGYHQAASLPSRNNVVEFLGSTTGPSYNNSCSPFKVNWSVTPTCNTLDIKTVHKWCESNVFEEDYAHGIRKLVTNPKHLSPIK